MSAILPFVRMDSTSLLARYFTKYQIAWIQAEDPFHEAKKQVFALAEKSVRIGWTFCDGFKNVRKLLRFKNRDYLFVTKDWPSALEYMNHVYDFAVMLGYTRAVLSHGEDLVKVKSLDPEGRPTSLTEEVKIGYIKFQNGSRIIAFSSNPYATAVYGGDVGLDEFAKHPNAKVLWQSIFHRAPLAPAEKCAPISSEHVNLFPWTRSYSCWTAWRSCIGRTLRSSRGLSSRPKE